MRFLFGLLHMQSLPREAFEFKVMPMSQSPSAYLSQGKNGFGKVHIISYAYLHLMAKH